MRGKGKSSATSIARFNSSIASMRRTRSTSQIESGCPLSRVALKSRLVGACTELSVSPKSARLAPISCASAFEVESKCAREQKISTREKPAPANCPSSSRVSFRETKRYVDSSLCTVFVPSAICREFLSLVAYCRTFVPRVRRSQSVAALRINPNRIHQSNMPPQFHRKPPRLQRLPCAFRKIFFHENLVRQPLVMKPRRIDRR